MPEKMQESFFQSDYGIQNLRTKPCVYHIIVMDKYIKRELPEDISCSSFW